MFLFLLFCNAKYPTTMRRARRSAGPERHMTTPFRRCIQFSRRLMMPPPVATTHFLYAATSASTEVSTSRNPSSPSAAKISGMVIFVTDSMISSLDTPRKNEKKKKYICDAPEVMKKK